MENFNDKIDNYRGLTADEAANRLDMYGYNSDSRRAEDGGDFKILRVMLSLRFLLLIAAAIVFFIAGAAGQGFVMLLLAGTYCAAEIFKGMKCRDAFIELKRISGVRYRVLRDCTITLLRKEYIVPDDIIILQEGESVPADAHLLETQNLTADESFFTDDRSPAVKRAGADTKNEIKQTVIYKGTRILSGNAIARVTATGIDTKKCREFGENPETESYKTGIEKAVVKAQPIFFGAAGLFFVVYFILALVSQPEYVSETGEIEAFAVFVEIALKCILPALAIALCLLPSEIPRLVRAHYLFGAFSLLKKNCVVKDLNAVSALSAITAVCVDKTGVITKNHTTPVDEYTTDEETMARISVLSCAQTDTSDLDRAIILGAAFKSVDVKSLQENELIAAYPYSEETKLGGNLWRINKALLLCVKGSPENVLTKCVLPHDALFAVQQKHQKYAEQGHRVVAVAYAKIDEEENGIPDSVYDAEYTFVGLAAFANQTRDSAPAAVRSCYRAGVKVIMTTGDSADAAITIGRKIGLTEPLAVTGDYLRECRLNGEKPEIGGVNIFARATLDQKPYIIDLLQDEGEIVAVTGIGAADVEALERANVGVALPQETSGAAKEVCGLVLADDDFNSVVDALKETRQIHYNIKQSIGAALTAVITTITFALFCILTGVWSTQSGNPAFTPAAVSLPAIVFLPLLSLAFFGNRAGIKGEMYASGFVGRGALDKKFFIRAVAQGLCISLAVIIPRLLLENESPGVLQSCFLTAVIGGLIGTVLVNLSANIPMYRVIAERNNAALSVIGAALLLLILLVYLPFVNSAFGLSPLNPVLFVLMIILGFISQLWVEIPKIRDGQRW
jgi:Ca2+-transporting ATPase